MHTRALLPFPPKPLAAALALILPALLTCSTALSKVEGEAAVDDYAISAPVDLGPRVAMPKADRTARPAPPTPAHRRIEVKLFAAAENSGKETASFGVPFPPGVFHSDAEVTVFQGDTELPVASKVLAPWRIDAKEGSPRSVLVQFPLEFAGKAEQSVTVRWDKPRTRSLDRPSAVKDLLNFKTIQSTTKYEGHKEESPVTLRYEEPKVLAAGKGPPTPSTRSCASIKDPT